MIPTFLIGPLVRLIIPVLIVLGGIGTLAYARHEARSTERIACDARWTIQLGQLQQEIVRHASDAIAAGDAVQPVSADVAGLCAHDAACRTRTR